ncbi:hypothetical protein FRB93_000877 [Tulasnella sp. JGI-2019a]|nr:hypothetical protein FRB93_000877 [Tulasnella sp. JGI-2019a]
MSGDPQPGPIFLPQITIQSDVQAVIDDIRQGTSVSEDIWISCYLRGEPSLHCKATVLLDDDGSSITMEGRDGVYIKAASSAIYEVSCPSLGINPTRLRAPKVVYRDLKAQQVRNLMTSRAGGAAQATHALITTQIPRAISSFDIAPNGSVYATGFDNGSIAISSVSSSSASRLKTGKPHASTITSLRFFPSSEVLLASSLDMSLSIISAIDLTVPRQFKGHSRSVTDTAIIERGKNVISSGKDGTVRLWDVGAGKQIRMMGTEGWSPVLKMAVGANTTQIRPSSANNDTLDGISPAQSFMDGEIGTQDKVLCCALQNGRFSILDLNTKMAVYNSASNVPSSPLHAIAYNSERYLIATGSGQGVVTIYDTRALGTDKGMLFRCQRNEACIEDLAFSEQTSAPSPELVVGTVDGLPFRLAIDTTGPRVVEELVGFDCDPVRVVRTAAGHTWVAGDDGLVRKF